MSVNWYWSHKIGHINISQRGNLLKDGTREPTRHYQVGIYGGNCLGILIYKYKKEDGSRWYNLFGFWVDKTHLRRCLSLEKDYKDVPEFAKFTRNKKDYEAIAPFTYILHSIHLNTFYDDSILIGKQFALAGFKVVLYYKNMEEAKQKCKRKHS